MQWLLKAIFGTKHQRDIRAMRPIVARINGLEAEYQKLSEAEIKAKTGEFRERLAKGVPLDDLLCEAFAAVKNACRRLVGTKVVVCGHERAWDMIPFDVQLMGGIVLHQGKISEMATGEGKTLVATLPLYLNALPGKNVHLVTVNDYLARRDAQWMGHVLTYLGLTVGCIQNTMTPAERRAQYACDITYGTNSEFGFDYLRDNGMAWRAEDQVQRGYHYAIVDEVDSILIDEARTPLIISGPAPEATNQYAALKPRVERLVRRQLELCNRLVKEAKDFLAKDKTQDEFALEEAKLRLYQANHGMPKNKQFLHLLEDPAIRKMHEQIESAMLTEMRKEQARALREELFFTIDEKGHDATLTEKGCEEMSPADPEAYVLPDIVASIAELEGDTAISDDERTRRRQALQETFTERSERIHNVDQLIRAYCLYERDVGYVVQNNQVLIVDEFTGRILPGRRWSDGLHQAIEAKEGVTIEQETQTLATITIQNYFRMYAKLAGMTGTAETEADEFHQIYKLDVVVIPTNRPVRRVDLNDQIYKTQREKFKAVIDEIADCHQRGQPVLVGTVSVETSELLSRMLNRAKIPHNVLNAKNHEKEAEIVEHAGQRGAVTIATNMAGRGTDIKLGPEVVWLDRSVITSDTSLDGKVGGASLRRLLLDKPCGLHVIGSERHEARRIDRQLRGRCARQGDPGSSRFYVSLEDDLMRLFGSDRIAGVMERMGLEEGQVLEHKLLNRSIEQAQRRVEQQNFSIRKRTLEYDDVMNKQREIVYTFRGDVVRAPKVREMVLDLLYEVIATRAESMLTADEKEGPRAFVEWAHATFPISLRANEIAFEKRDTEPVAKMVFERVRHAYDIKLQLENPASIDMLERHVVLQSIDMRWQDYLRSMDSLRQGVGLRAYGQRDPLIEYKREAFEMFTTLMDDIHQEIASKIFRASTTLQSAMRYVAPGGAQVKAVHDQVALLGRGGQAAPQQGGGAPRDEAGSAVSEAVRAASQPVHREGPKVGRNDPCPCGSGKKYKKCCGASA